MGAIPGFGASDISSWYGSGTLTSRPWQGSGTSGLYGSLGAPPSVGAATPYQFQDISVPQAQAGVVAQAAKSQVGTPASEDYRAALAKGAKPAAGTESLYDGLLGLDGKAIAAVPVRGTAQSSNYSPAQEAREGSPAIPQLTSRSAINAYGLAERARQEAAAGKQENRERGNTILAGYDQSIANNRAMSDQMLAMNQGYGASMVQQLQNDYTQRLAQSNQAAMKRGLGNTTIRDSLNRGVTSAYDLARMQLGDQLTQRDIGLVSDGLGRENQGSAQRLGFLSSIQNDYPTSADYGNYLLQSGVLQETAGSRK